MKLELHLKFKVSITCTSTKPWSAGVLCEKIFEVTCLEFRIIAFVIKFRKIHDGRGKEKNVKTENFCLK